MTPMASLLLLLAILSSLSSITRAQDRAPHGIASENPVAFSPSVFAFFQPKTHLPSSKNPCAPSNCSTLPIAATVQSNLAQESRSTTKTGGSQMGAGGLAGIVFGSVFVVLLAVGVYYVVIARLANLSQTNSVQPDV